MSEDDVETTEKHSEHPEEQEVELDSREAKAVIGGQKRGSAYCTATWGGGHASVSAY